MYAINGTGDTSKYGAVKMSQNGLYEYVTNKTTYLGKTSGNILAKNVYIMNLDELLPNSPSFDTIKTSIITNKNYSREWVDIIAKDSLGEFSGNAKIHVSSEEGIHFIFGLNDIGSFAPDGIYLNYPTTTSDVLVNGTLRFFNAEKNQGENMYIGHQGEDYVQLIRLTDDGGLEFTTDGYIDIATNYGSMNIRSNEADLTVSAPNGRLNLNGNEVYANGVPLDLLATKQFSFSIYNKSGLDTTTTTFTPSWDGLSGKNYVVTEIAIILTSSIGNITQLPEYTIGTDLPNVANVFSGDLDIHTAGDIVYVYRNAISAGPRTGPMYMKFTTPAGGTVSLARYTVIVRGIILN